MGLSEFLVRKLEVVPSGSNNVPEAVGVLASVAVGDSKGSLVSNELTSVRVGVVFGGTAYQFPWENLNHHSSHQ